MNRPSIHMTMLEIALVLSRRSTCVRRQVGCVITNFNNQIIAAGYNGVASGTTHCTHTPCAGAAYGSGLGLDSCEAIHAEINALIQCKDIADACNIYCTTAPCISCTKALLSTPVQHVWYLHDYPQAEHSAALWIKSRVNRTFNDLQLEQKSI